MWDRRKRQSTLFMYFNRVQDEKILYILVALWGMVVVAEAQIAIDMRKQDIVDGVSVEILKWNVMEGTLP